MAPYRKLSCFVVLFLLLGGRVHAADVLEVKAGQELILEPIEGTVASASLTALRVPNARIVRRGKRRLLAALEGGSALGRGVHMESAVLVDKRDIERACAAYAQAGLRCSPNVIVSIRTNPDDTFYSLLYGVGAVSAPTAWATTTGVGAVVAVVDTGVKYDHEDLSANIAINSAETPGNSIDDDGNGYIDDYYGLNAITYTGPSSSSGNPTDDNGHGTHVSGTIAAVGNNATGVIGIAYGAKILAVKALAANGSGSISDVIEGIDYAVARGVDVINLSLGSPSNVPALEASLERARDQGVLVVAAAGNHGVNIDSTPSYPAAYQLTNLISVAATDSADAITYFSNFGAGAVHVAAPGDEIASTYFTGSYAFLSGTSMAAPHVAGVAALVKSANSALGAASIKDIILNNVDLIAGLAGKVSTGGRVNAARAVAAAQAGDTGGGGAGETEARALGVSTRTLNAKATRVVGRLYNSSTQNGIDGASVSLVCKTKVRGTKTTAVDGALSFSVKRPLKGKANLTCYLIGDGLRSSNVKVRALK